MKNRDATGRVLGGSKVAKVSDKRVDLLLHVVKLQTALLMGCLVDFDTVLLMCCLSRIGAGEIIDSLEGMKLWTDGCQGDAFGESWQEALVTEVMKGE
ncbi:hypothetical protein V6N13_131488 [Hibiscus sabdariffa]|uniref:Uncharacterized protein n=1 Tax=Hibiscus sabdariffa TaxID=183260 RepID=A0ABR2D8W0_9ROSI